MIANQSRPGATRRPRQSRGLGEHFESCGSTKIERPNTSRRPTTGNAFGSGIPCESRSTVEHQLDQLIDGGGVDAAARVVPRDDQRAVGAAALFVRQDTLVAVPLVLLSPASPCSCDR